MNVDAVGLRTSASTRFPTAARGSPCRRSGSATAARPCAAAPSSPEASDAGSTPPHLPSPPEGRIEDLLPSPLWGRARVRGSGAWGARTVVMLFVAAMLLGPAPLPAATPRCPRSTSRWTRSRRCSTRSKRVTIIDVRDKDQYDELHIKGARSMSRSRELPTRGSARSRSTEPVVLY